MEPENPYQSPLTTSPRREPETSPGLQPAAKGRRLANFLLDQVFYMVLCFVFGLIIVLMGAEEIIEKVPDFVFGMIMLLIYYVPQEALLGQTLAKLITGTKVVDESGGDASFGQVLARTFCRMIPFEPFSFLGSRPTGWHDRISRTLVVEIR